MNKKYKSILITVLVLVFFILYEISKAEDKWRTINIKKASRFIKVIKTDKTKIYIGTANGVAVYDIKRDSILKVLQKKDGLVENYITSIAIDKVYIWIGTDNGLCRYNKKSGKIITFTKKDGIVDDAVSFVVVDGDYIWVGTKYWGISRYDKTINRWQTFSVINGLVDNTINCITVEGSFVWVGTKNGLSYYDKITGLWGGYDTTQGLQVGNILSIEVAGQFLWLGTDNGLIRFDKYEEIFKLFTTEHGLADDYIQNLKLDGVYLWIGTFSGVTRYNIQKDDWFTYTVKDGLIENSVSAIEVRGNDIWFGTDGNGISIFDKDIPQAYISPLSFYSKAGKIIVMGTAYDDNINSYKIEYKNEAMKGYVSAGVTLLKTGNVMQAKLAEWDVKKLFNINYDVRLLVTDSAGNNNTAIGSFTVDTKAPQMTLNLLPEAVRVPSIFVKGTYIDNNITKIIITINDKIKEKAELNRILKQYSKEIQLTKGLNNINIKAFDIANLYSEINTKVVYDKEKPIITLESFPEKAKDKKIELKGKIIDSGIQRLVLNPGNEEIVFKKSEEDNTFTFSHELKLEPGFNKYELSAYDFVGNKTIVNPIIEYVSSLPVVSIDKSLLRAAKSEYVIKGSWSDDNVDYITIEPFNKRAVIDTVNRTFSFTSKLKKGENVITANIIDKDGNKYFDVVTVFYSTEKGSLNLVNLKKFTFLKKFVLNGFYNESNLKKLILKPGDINIPVDKGNQKFSIGLNLKEGLNKFNIVMIDKFGSKSTRRDFSITLDMLSPIINLIKTPTIVYAKALKLEGSYDDKHIDKIYIMPDKINCTINPKENNFTASLKLKEGLNDIQVVALDKAGNKTELLKTITYLPRVNVKEFPDAVDSKYVQELKDEIVRLKALLKQSKGTGSVVYREAKFTLPKKSGFVLIPYSKLKAYSLFEISKKYLGHYLYLDFINKYNNVSSISKDKFLLLPTKPYIKKYVKISNPGIKSVLDIVAISYKYSNKNYNKFRQKLGYYLYKKNFITRKDYKFFIKNRYIKAKNFNLSINSKRKSNTPYNINVTFNKSFMDVSVRHNKLYGKK